jgi:hypothetical protein
MRNLLWSGLVMAVLLSGCGWSGSASRPNTITPLTSITITAKYTTIAQNTSVKLTATGNYSGLFTRDISNQVTWTSNAITMANFVTTASPNRVTGLAPGSAVLTATLGGVSANFNLTVSSATISTVTITPANPSIALGLTQQFAATGAFSDGTTQDITFDANWASSNTTVATVSNAADDNNGGLATTVAAGTTTITATFGAVNGVGGANSTVLTVTAPVLQSIIVSTPNTSATEPNPSVLSLSTVTFTATGTYSDGTTPDITSQVTWNSSNTNVAPAPLFSGTLASTQTVTQGTTTITATLGTVSGTTTLNVTGGNLASFPKLTNMTVVNGTSLPISVIGTFGTNISRDITGVLTWTVANQNIATVMTVSGNRVLINALAPGTTTITATSPGSPGQFSTANLTVTNPGLSSFSVSPSTGLALAAGTSGRLTATALFSDGTSQDVTANVTWLSSASTIATVGAVGPNGVQINGVAAGLTTITATFGNQTVKNIPVSVTARTLSSFTIILNGTIIPNGGTVSLTSGQQTPFTVTANYSGGFTQDVTADTTWATRDGNIAILADSQNQPGQVIGVGSGTTTLTVSFGGQTSTVTLNVP